MNKQAKKLMEKSNRKLFRRWAKDKLYHRVDRLAMKQAFVEKLPEYICGNGSAAAQG